MALGDKNLTFKPISDFIQRSVGNCAEAQHSIFDVMLEYIEETTFTKKGRKRELAMLHFSFEQNGQKYVMKIPLITVSPPQVIQIRNVEVNFNLITKVEDINNRKTLIARISPSREAIKEKESSVFDLRNIINVNIKAADLGISGGMSRLMELASTQAIRVKKPDE